MPPIADRNAAHTRGVQHTRSSVSGQSDEVPLEFEYAGMARRLAAFLIDFVVVSILQLGLGVLLVVSAVAMEPISADALDAMITTISIVVAWLYYAVMESSLQQATLDKLALRLQVVDTLGRRTGFARASVRFFAKCISAVGFLRFIIIDFNPTKQGLHDIIARCLVIRRARAAGHRPDPRFA